MDKVTMSVQEMAMQMGISLSKAYALTREDGYQQEPLKYVASSNKRERRSTGCTNSFQKN